MNARNRTIRSRTPAKFKSNGERKSPPVARIAAAQSEKLAVDSQLKPGAAKAAISRRFPIVGVGASAGGLDAFTQLLNNLPMDTGMAFVLVQHLDPHHESALARLLAQTTSMTVSEVIDGTKVAPDNVYVIPPNTCMEIVSGVLKLR